jgi:PAS domain S-box-containing protein
MLDVTPRATAVPAAADFLAGGGEAGRRMRELEWSGTPLGPPRDWPAPLRTAARIVLASRHPVCVWWGADCALLYNDACQPIVSAVAETALGMPAPTAWLEGPEQITVREERGGRMVECRYALALSPVPGENGALGGVLCTFFDTTPAETERSARPAETLQEVAARAELAATKEELAAQVESLTQLHELAIRLGGMAELPQMLESVLETAVAAQDADYGLVWLHERETGNLVVRASRNFDGEALRYFSRVTPGPAGGAAGNAFASHCRWIIEDVESDPGFEPFRQGARTAGFRAVHSTPIVTSSGELLGVISVHFARKHHPSRRDMQVADVCARHAADAIEGFRRQKALRESEMLYRAIGESINYGVWVCDAAGRNTYASESFLRLTGLTQEECAGFGWGSVLHPDERERTVAQWQEAVRTGGSWDVEHRIRGVDGQWHSVLARGVPVRDEQGAITGWAGINLDIDQLKRVEEELRELDQRKDEFLATLAHELRNPLAPLRNGLEVMKLATSAATIEKARAMMERQLSQMVRLVDDLLDVSRVSRGKIELRRADIDIASVLRNAIETSQPLVAERMHQLVTRLPKERIVVDADLTRLSQVFWNLLNNAAKYTLPGGVIELEVVARDAEVVISIRDNGIGIPPDMQARVFDIFTQVDRSLEKSQGGLGIGLSIAKRLVEMHGGTIAVRSDGRGKGSEFTVRLPARVDAAAAHAEPDPESVRATACHRVLIAEDNADSASTLGILLEAAGNDVRIAHDGKEALGVARAFQPDVVLLDIGMPRMNGYDACREMRSEPWARRAYFVALTGWAQPEDRERAHASGFDCHLVKPVEPADLERMIRELPRRD